MCLSTSSLTVNSFEKCYTTVKLTQKKLKKFIDSFVLSLGTDWVPNIMFLMGFYNRKKNGILKN